MDRQLSNQGLDVSDSFAAWVPRVVEAWRSFVVAMDWTNFDRDGQATLALNLVTPHVRATPFAVADGVEGGERWETDLIAPGPKLADATIDPCCAPVAFAVAVTPPAPAASAAQAY